MCQQSFVNPLSASIIKSGSLVQVCIYFTNAQLEAFFHLFNMFNVSIHCFFPLTATTIQSPEITLIARYPDDPTTVQVVWDSASAEVVDINVYWGSTFNVV